MMGSVAGEPFEGQAEFRLVPAPDSGDTTATYSNFVQATVSPHDLTLHFGWYAIPPLVEAPKDTTDVSIRPVIKVTVPLNLVRGVIDLLERQLVSWEQSFSGSAKEQTPAAAKDKSA